MPIVKRKSCEIDAVDNWRNIRDHNKSSHFDAKEETVRKFMKTCAMHVSKNDWELVRVLPHTEHSLSNLFAKARP